MVEVVRLSVSVFPVRCTVYRVILNNSSLTEDIQAKILPQLEDR